jgi:hypothetical protein
MVATAAIGVPATASANGRFPAATQLVVVKDRGVMTSSFGLVTTVDHFATPSWSCEKSLGYDPAFNNDLGVGIFADGTVVISGPEGLTISTDRTCTNPAPAGPIADLWFADVTVDGMRPSSGLAVSRGKRGQDCTGGEIFESLDNGRSWAKIAPLPTGFCPLTIDSAPSDVKRLFVSGNVLRSDGLRLEGQLLVSEDRGATWASHVLPDEPRPFIAAIDPLDKDTIYVRTSNPPDAGRLLVSSDGAKTFRTIATLTGVPLQFFGVTGVALSPDGSKLAYGSVNEGLFVADGRNTAANKRSSMPVMCLAWTAEGLYACSAPNLCGPFLIGVSRDDGRSFDPVVPALDIKGDRTTCAPGTPGANLCPDQWEAPRQRFADCSDAGAAAQDGGPADGGAAPPPLPRVACDCRYAGTRHSSADAQGALALAVMAACARALRARTRRVSETATRGRSASRRPRSWPRPRATRSRAR